GQEVFRQESDFFHVNRQFAGPGAEQVTAHADVVAQIEQFVERKTLLAYEVELHVDLQLLPALLQVGESGLALQAQGDHAPGHFHRDARLLQLFAGVVTEVAQNLRHSVGSRKATRVSLLAQGFNFAQLLLAQLIRAVFEGHWFLYLRKTTDYKLPNGVRDPYGLEDHRGAVERECCLPWFHRRNVICSLRERFKKKAFLV